ncbi:energy transducer TonB [Polynucleobacter sp. MWH-UH23A]|uniref:energy transducer TonB n=1 Tax=Polynucleobacter sp. MWH-UH23A TaxID=1855613 RepID=UPI003364CB88
MFDIRKREVLDFGSTTGPIFVHLHQSVKLKTQARHDDAVVLDPRALNNQKSADTESESIPKLPSLGGTAAIRNMSDLRPTKIDGPKPHYPIASRRLREEGEVLVRLCIDSSGAVETAQIQKSSGYRNLDHSALSALSKWRFLTPYQLINNDLAECFRFPVRFTLEG